MDIMKLDDRSSDLLQELLSYPYIKNKNLEMKLGLSRKQISYDLKKINAWLSSHNLPSIERTKQGTFIIEPDLVNTIRSELNKTSTKKYMFRESERIAFILLMLLSREEELSLVHFTLAIRVSKNTILKDIKEAQCRTRPYQLKIEYSRQSGYTVEGDELRQRKLLIDILNRIHEMNNGEEWIRQLAAITDEEQQWIHQCLEKIERRLAVKFTDDRWKILANILLIVRRRIKRGHTIHSFDAGFDEISATKEYRAAGEELLADLETVPTGERCFIALLLLTTNLSSMKFLGNDFELELERVITGVVERFENIACVKLQEKNRLLKMMIQHVKPAYYRIKYKLAVSNPLEQMIESQFKELHQLVKTAAKPLADFIGSEIPESEYTYFTMLFGGWLKRQGDSIQSKPKALVVCTNGVSVSHLLIHTLRDWFPEFVFLDSLSVREFQNYHEEFDLVFSTVPLQTSKKWFKVKALLTDEEKRYLRKQVIESLHGLTHDDLRLESILEIVEKHAIIQNREQLAVDLQQYFTSQCLIPVQVQKELRKAALHELIKPQNVTLRHSVPSWKEAIRLAAQPLLQQKRIDPSYIDAIIQHYNPDDPYILIGPHVAIPHGSPDRGVHELGMSLLRLKKGVEFAPNREIHIIVVVAAVDKEQHLRALVQLMKLAGNQADCEAIIRARTADEIHGIIAKYSKY